MSLRRGGDAVADCVVPMEKEMREAGDGVPPRRR
jgi:hypothetical protein